MLFISLRCDAPYCDRMDIGEVVSGQSVVKSLKSWIYEKLLFLKAEFYYEGAEISSPLSIQIFSRFYKAQYAMLLIVFGWILVK